MVKNTAKASSTKSPRQKLYGRIHALMSERNISRETYEDILFVNFDGCASKSDLTDKQLVKLIQHLEGVNPPQPPFTKGGCRQAGGFAYPGRPHNMDSTAALKAGRSTSRADQLGKIEALLTVGSKSWAYADSMAKRICKVDKLAWVPTGNLYKIITALRKQARREGWDLSGEKK